MNNKFKILVFLTVIFIVFSVANLTAGNLLQNSDFSSGSALPWELYYAASSDGTSGAAASYQVVNGECALNILKPTTNRWDIQLRHRAITIENGHTYRVQIKMRATASCRIYPKIGMAGSPYTEWWNMSWAEVSLPAGQNVLIDQTFTMTGATDPTAEFALHCGGTTTAGTYPYTIYIDNIYLLDDQYIPTPTPTPIANTTVRVNQVGYLVNGIKKATAINTSTAPVTWQLKNSAGTVVVSGSTTVYGNDAASGDRVHKIDFTSYTTAGNGYTLEVAGAASHKFDIRSDIYAKLKYDALAYFYHNRSGIAITMPYSGGTQWVRAAGHLPDIAQCAAGVGDYSLDVTKGWYDAGDHGKYVVNGGISIWTMLNQYERTLYTPGSTNAPYADGKMLIPENANGIPDILDEARWEMEFLLKMQVPAGKPKAGMVHHKMNDAAWTGIPTAPAEDTQPRYLYMPSTAATLNLAAAAAQCSRIWKPYDATFATQCLTAAETAWNAANTNPVSYFDGTNTGGGGGYGDNNVTDEFYWAACELYVTTGKSVYLTYLQSSTHYLKVTSGMMAFDWGTLNSLGTLTLALVPNQLGAANITTARNNILTAADYYLNNINSEGYMVPLTSTGYIWGSNSIVVNKAIVMSYAYDFSPNNKYLDGVIQSMDYLLGRNPTDYSYVTGYGTRPVQNPHHRFWAYQANHNYPKPPAGALSGGPNSNDILPIEEAAGLVGLPPAKIFLDDINCYTANEITINWNAPLAWVAAYLDEKSGGTPPVLLGDVNSDGLVNINDALLVARYSAGLNPSNFNVAAADVSKDGVVSVVDALMIARYAAGLISGF